MIKVGIIFGLAMASVTSANAADWGGKEVQASTTVALETFLASKGSAAYLSVSAITNEVSAQKNSSKVKITYVDGAVKKTQGYFCHTHDTDIDCH